jgi:hypothetical protein
MIAASGVRSNMPALGMIRRRGARIGSVILSRITVSAFGLGENQDRITLIKIANVSTSHKKLIKLRNQSMPTHLIL